MEVQLLKGSGVARAPSNAASGIKVSDGVLILVSGQVAWDENGQVVGEGDIRAQARKAFSNLEKVLNLGGAGLTDIVKFNFYLTDLAHRAAVLEVRHEVMGEHRPPSTTVVVTSLVDAALLIEIDAVACVAR